MSFTNGNSLNNFLPKQNLGLRFLKAFRAKNKYLAFLHQCLHNIKIGDKA
jgi:hypothetical protein